MIDPIAYRSRLRRAAQRRGMATYLYVSATALLVSLLALSASAVVRIERRQAEAFGSRLTARTLAHAAAELGLKTIKSDPSWRTTYSSGTYTTPTNLDAAGAGSVSWSLQDSDGSLTNADVQLRLKGVGRVGDALQVASFQLQAQTIGPVTHRSLTTSGSSENVKSNRWFGQYFIPTLPTDALQWWVSSVEFYMRRDHGNQTFRVCLYRPDGSNMPTAEILDQVSRNTDDFSSIWGWQTITLSGAYMLNPGDGLCLCVESTSPDPIDLEVVSAAAANSALIRGTPAWSSYETDKGLRYRVNGYYVSASGVTRVSGSWRWDAP